MKDIKQEGLEAFCLMDPDFQVGTGSVRLGINFDAERLIQI